MDKKKMAAQIAMAAFLAACFIPGVGMFFQKETHTAANQILAPAPKMRQPDGSWNPDVLKETTDYVADHFAFRQELITANAALDAALFAVSAEDSVTMGKDGWLFYQETLADYLGTEPLSPRQLFGAAHTLALLREYAASQGARLFVTIAPNKSSLYPEYLPPIGTPLSTERDVNRLIPFLEAEKVPYIDLFGPFQDQNEILYYRTDSHWTTRGAALAHDHLLEGMGITDNPRFFQGSYRAGEPHRGDLYEMLFPAGTQTEPDEIPEQPWTFSYVRQPRSAEDQWIETQNPARNGTLLMFRDSFGNSLHPFLADSYGRAFFSRSMPYQMSFLEQTQADTVLIEIVERNLEWLALHAPVFPAPVRMAPEADYVETDWFAKYSIVEDGKLDSYVCLQGSMFEGATDDTSPILVQIGDLCLEASLAGKFGSEWNSPSFTLYIPKNLSAETVEVFFQRGGQWTQVHTQKLF